MSLVARRLNEPPAPDAQVEYEAVHSLAHAGSLPKVENVGVEEQPARIKQTSIRINPPMTSDQINELLKRAGVDVTAYYSGPRSRTSDTLYPLVEALLTRIEALERRIPADYDLPARVSQQDNYADAIDKLSTTAHFYRELTEEEQAIANQLSV